MRFTRHWPSRGWKPGVTFLALWVVLGTAAPARAQTACADLNLPNPVYGDGGSAAQPYIGKLAAVLAGLPAPVTLVYKASSACNGINGVLANATDPATGRLSGTVFYWTAAGTQMTCTLPATGGPPITWANMVNSHKLCSGPPAALPANIGDVEGPVTAVNLFTNKASTETVISAEAAYLAYGFPNGEGQSPPWTTESLLFRRNATSAVGLYVGLAIGVPAARHRGTEVTNQTMAINGVANATTPAAALGYASSDAVDQARATVKTLAYQHKGQVCGYLPDSADTSFDKKNVRDGHYWLWGAQHFYGVVDPTTKEFTNPAVAQLIGLVTGKVSPPAGVDVAKLAIETGNVPRCAMTVWRDGDLGEFYSYAPPEPCACYYEKNVPGGSTTCTPCTAKAECVSVGATAECRKGFCEAY